MSYIEGNGYYCGVCGLHLVFSVFDTGWFDDNRGFPIWGVRYKCPNKKWWNFHACGNLKSDGCDERMSVEFAKECNEANV